MHSEGISDAHKELPSEAGDGLKQDVEGDERREKRLSRTISIFEAAMLAFVAVLAAWSGYAAAKWSTESSLLLATAGADRAKANAASLDAVNVLNFDATTFNDWFTAYVGGNRSAMAIAEARFTLNLDAAFRAWLATGPETNMALCLFLSWHRLVATLCASYATTRHVSAATSLAGADSCSASRLLVVAIVFLATAPKPA